MTYQNNEAINIGIAVDTEHGLFVPVLKDVANQTVAALRETINRFKTQAQTKSIPQDDLQGATIILSNYGSICRGVTLTQWWWCRPWSRSSAQEKHAKHLQSLMERLLCGD